MNADAERLLEVCEAEDIDTVWEIVTNDVIEEQAQEESTQEFLVGLKLKMKLCCTNTSGKDVV